MKHILSVDIGTTSLKACIFNEQLNIVAQCSKEYKLITDGEFIEFPAEEYFNIFLSAYSELTQKQKIDGICIDTQGETLIVADESGRPLYNAINWLDNRAIKEAGDIEKHFGIKKIYEITGQPEVPAGFPASKLLWFKNKKPDIFRNIRKIFLLEDYILFRLTGNFCSEKTLQSSSLYFDISCGCYWEDMLEFIGITKEQLPYLYESGERAGYYNNIPVFFGALDQISGMIGAGVTQKGVASEMTGTTLAVCFISDTIPKWREGLKIPCHYFSKDKYAIIMWSGTAGMALQWFKDNFYKECDFIQIDSEVSAIPSGSEGLTFLPYLTGSVMPKYNPDIRGVFYGIELKHGRAHFARSIMESVACILKQFLDYSELEVKEIISIGGGAKSPLWCQIKADITGKTIITLKQSEIACLGSAIIGFMGLGVFKDINDIQPARYKVYYPAAHSNGLEIYKRFIITDKLINN